MSLYNHFRIDEHEFVDKVLEWKSQVEMTHQSKLIDFLDPREQFILSSIIGNNGDVQVSFYGGNNNVERKRAIIHHDYAEIQEKDFCLCLVNIVYPVKFSSITHPEVLGSLMGVGLKRQKYGDILIQDKIVQIVIAEEIVDFVQLNLKQVGRVTIQIEPTELHNIVQGEDIWNVLSSTVASFRIDTVISEIFRISRQKSQLLIGSGNVKLNHKVIEKSSFEVETGDMISVRGKGRCKVLTTEGKTKRDKWRITYGVK